MKITTQEQVAIAHCLQQVANAIASNPSSSVSLGYQDGMKRSGHEPLAVHQLRDLAEQIFVGNLPSLISEADHTAMQSLVSEMSEVCKGMVLNPRQV